MRLNLNRNLVSQTGFTLLELMMVIAIIGILAAVATFSYYKQLRQSELIVIYQELNYFRQPYQILINEGVGRMDFSPNSLNMPEQTKYCYFSVTAPNVNDATPNAVTCAIQNIPYLQGQSLSIDYLRDGKWQCHASAGIKDTYLPKACR